MQTEKITLKEIHSDKHSFPDPHDLYGREDRRTFQLSHGNVQNVTLQVCGA